MNLIDTPADMCAWSDDRRAAGLRICLVPTMGALHDGHLALVREARSHGDLVVASIFVNPLQFNVSADFDTYPRPIGDDLRACAANAVDTVYAPTAAAMYPQGFDTHVEPGALADTLEGASRPGHFRGVATVVAKLFTAVRPHVAIFGQKDAQQLAIIRRMTVDLDLGVEIVAMPTVRERDGLAMSSRNRRLSTAERAAATCISAGLFAARRAFDDGMRDADVLVAAATAPIEAAPLARIEYVALIDPDTFQPVEQVETQALIAAAAWFGDVRLIDNVPLQGGSGTG